MNESGHKHGASHCGNRPFCLGQDMQTFLKRSAAALQKLGGVSATGVRRPHRPYVRSAQVRAYDDRA